MASNETAVEAYNRLQTEVNAQLAQIQELLKKHAEQFAKNQGSWGYPGDMGHVKEVLSVVTEFLRKETYEAPWEGRVPDFTTFVNEGKKDSKAEVRNRGKVVFPAESKYVSDDKDHFPINDIGQARNALARAGQYSSKPEWFNGSLELLKTKVKNKVKREYPSIEVTE